MTHKIFYMCTHTRGMLMNVRVCVCARGAKTKWTLKTEKKKKKYKWKNYKEEKVAMLRTPCISTMLLLCTHTVVLIHNSFLRTPALPLITWPFLFCSCVLKFFGCLIEILNETKNGNNEFALHLFGLSIDNFCFHVRWFLSKREVVPSSLSKWTCLTRKF